MATLTILAACTVAALWLHRHVVRPALVSFGVLS